MSKIVRLHVVGSVNLDLVARVGHLPVPGETVTGAVFSQHPGGKGANQALAAQRLGAQVSLIARIGDDAHADAALALLRRDGVDLGSVATDPARPTGVALIAVDASGENQIVVASGANGALTPEDLPDLGAQPVLCVLEVPVATVMTAARRAKGFFAVNLAPALPVPDGLIARADLIIVNEIEAASYGPALEACGGLVVTTFGARGARIARGGVTLAEGPPPAITPVDTVGAGDAFTAAITLAVIEGQSAVDALAFAQAAGACAAMREGAQSSLPDRAELEALRARS